MSDLPPPRGRVKIRQVKLRPTITIDSVDHKTLLKASKLLDMTVNKWIEMQIRRALGNE